MPLDAPVITATCSAGDIGPRATITPFGSSHRIGANREGVPSWAVAIISRNEAGDARPIRIVRHGILSAGTAGLRSARLCTLIFQPGGPWRLVELADALLIRKNEH